MDVPTILKIWRNSYQILKYEEETHHNLWKKNEEVKEIWKKRKIGQDQDAAVAAEKKGEGEKGGAEGS